MNLPRKPQRLARRVIYRNAWLNLYVDKVRFPGGRIVKEHHVVESDWPAVSAIVQNTRRQVLLVRVYRYVTGQIEWELPAGNVDHGESILKAARREVLEETGYDSSRLRRVYTFYPMNGSTNKVFHIVRARAGRRMGEPDPNEVQAVKWFSLPQIQHMVRERKIHDGLTLSALLFLFNPNLGPSA